jgi:hypothetical protein
MITLPQVVAHIMQQQQRQQQPQAVAGSATAGVETEQVAAWKARAMR